MYHPKNDSECLKIEYNAPSVRALINGYELITAFEEIAFGTFVYRYKIDGFAMLNITLLFLRYLKKKKIRSNHKATDTFNNVTLTVIDMLMTVIGNFAFFA